MGKHLELSFPKLWNITGNSEGRGRDSQAKKVKKKRIKQWWGEGLKYQKNTFGGVWIFS